MNNFTVSFAMTRYCLITRIFRIRQCKAGFHFETWWEKTKGLVLVVNVWFDVFFVLFLVYCWEAAPHRCACMKMSKCTWDDRLQGYQSLAYRQKSFRSTLSHRAFANNDSTLSKAGFDIFSRTSSTNATSFALGTFEALAARTLTISMDILCHSMSTSSASYRRPQCRLWSQLKAEDKVLNTRDSGIWRDTYLRPPTPRHSQSGWGEGKHPRECSRHE